MFHVIMEVFIATLLPLSALTSRGLSSSSAPQVEPDPSSPQAQQPTANEWSVRPVERRVHPKGVPVQKTHAPLRTSQSSSPLNPSIDPPRVQPTVLCCEIEYDQGVTRGRFSHSAPQILRKRHRIIVSG